MKDDALATGVDPVTVEVLRHRLYAITDQIEANIIRTAFSPLIYAYKDFAVGIVDADAQLLCMARGGIPLFCSTLLSVAVQDGLALYGPDGIKDGDVILCNYSGVIGQHLNNVVMYTPIFAPGLSRPCAFMVVVVHWMDVGGRDVGSAASNTTENIFQEGIQFRTVKLWSEGKPVADMYRMIEYNTRFPEMVLGDIGSQLAGCRLGCELYGQMLARYGLPVVKAAVQRILDDSERIARDVVRSMRDGTYHAETFLDDDGVEFGKPIAVRASVTVSGDSITVDLSGCAPVLKGAINSGRHGGGITAAAIGMAFIVGGEDAPNAGTFRPLSVTLPEGTFLSAPATAPMSRYSSPMATVVDVVLRAAGQALPERVVGGHHGTFGIHVFYGHDARGQLFRITDTSQGGYGASATADGPGPFKTLVHGDSANVPVELQEALYPYRFESVALRSDSAGAGRHRGGLGIVKDYLVTGPCRMNSAFDRVQCPPWGVAGGGDGVPGKVTIRRADGTEQVMLKGDTAMAPGDRVRVETAGGGGFGDPRQRPRAQVLHDLQRGYISEAAAREIYFLEGNE
jgi:N-methylhydantoinase B